MLFMLYKIIEAWRKYIIAIAVVIKYLNKHRAQKIRTPAVGAEEAQMSLKILNNNIMGTYGEKMPTSPYFPSIDLSAT